MGDFTNDSGNFTSAIKRLKKFDGRTPSDFRDWRKRLAAVLGVTRRDIASLVNGKSRPTEETTSTGISPALAGYNRANEDLYAILYLLTEKPADLLVAKHEDSSSGTGTPSSEAGTLPQAAGNSSSWTTPSISPGGATAASPAVAPGVIGASVTGITGSTTSGITSTSFGIFWGHRYLGQLGHHCPSPTQRPTIS